MSIRILFEGEIQNLECNPNSTIEEIISQYKQEYLHSNYDIKKFIIKINEKKCDLKSQIKSYINNNNNVFELLYDIEQKKKKKMTMVLY